MGKKKIVQGKSPDLEDAALRIYMSNLFVDILADIYYNYQKLSSSVRRETGAQTKKYASEGNIIDIQDNTFHSDSLEGQVTNLASVWF